MSETVGNVGSVGAVSQTSAAAPARTDALAEVQYYNLKAIGLNQTVSASEGGSDVPLGVAVNAYAGSPTSELISGTTRSTLSGASGMAANNPPPAATDMEPDPVQAHDMDEEPATASSQLIPIEQPQATAGNPYMAPPPAPAAASPQYAPQSVPNPYMAAPVNAPPPVPVATNAPVSAADDSDDDEKKPWTQATATSERDLGINDRDDAPADTWAPNAKRSKEFAALDTMKLTSPKEALAQWRAQQESARTSEMAASSAPPPAPAPPMEQQGTLQPLPAAATPQAVFEAEQPSQPAIAPQPQPQLQDQPAPAATEEAGNPWQAPTAPVQQGGFSLPPPTDGPQLSPAGGSQGFAAPAAPVDLSDGAYVNPNLTGSQNPTLTPAPVRSTPIPFTPTTNLMPNMPYLNPPGPQGMYQSRFQAMAAANLNPMTTNPMGMTGAAGFNPAMLGRNPMMPGMGMAGGNNMGLLGEDAENEAEQSSYGMFGNLDGSGRRANPGMGSSLLQTLGGTGGY